jgi:hypothetical protein
MRDAHKQPQVQVVSGLDFFTEQDVHQNDLENIMLEIMNAS